MPDKILIGTQLFEMGNIITFNAAGQEAGIAPRGSKAQLYMWYDEDQTVIGLCATNPSQISGWGDLDGEVGEYQGWWIGLVDLHNCIELKDTAKKYICKPIEFSGIDLKGKECVILTSIDKSGLVFVEFSENIGGCSADGLGKRGHCIAVPYGVLKNLKSEAKE